MHYRIFVTTFAPMRTKLPGKKFFCAFWILFLVAELSAHSQEFGGNPPSIKWQQVNIPAAKVIFPQGLDSAAFEVAGIIARMNNSIQPTIGSRQKQVSIVLQNQTTIANAYVGLAPFRSEFYLTPEQNSFDIGSLPWAAQLSIHEFRHVQQYNNFDVGFSHFLRALFGEGGQALGNDLAVPNWFFEGDAVFNETLVSDQGRGRLPWFFNGYRALWAAGKQYSWMKLRNGSYRDFTPDWYPTGYMLVAYGREKYGDQFWKKVTHDAASYKGGPYPLQRAIKKYSGIGFEQFRNDAMAYFKKQFSDTALPFDLNLSKFKGHFLANEEYPVYSNDSTLIYLKSTYDHLPVFVERKGAKEKIIGIRDVSLDSYFAYHDGKIVYAAYRPDLRWTYRDYSELELLDVASGEEHRLTKNSRYFSPDFSADGKTIVAVQEAASGKCDLHLLSANSGKLIKSVPNPDKLFFTYPKFYGNHQLVSAVRNSKGQMSLALIDIDSGKPNYLLPFSYQPLGFLSVYGDTILFSATSFHNDALFAYVASEGKFYQLKNSTGLGYIGSYQAALSTKKLATVGLTAVGYQLNQVNRNTAEWQLLPSSVIPGPLDNLGLTALQSNASAHLLDSINIKPLPEQKYSKSYHLFNFHSIIPTINDPDYSVALIGENVLNTFQSQLSFGYNRVEGYKEVGFDALYGALFPFLHAGIDYSFDRRGYYKGGNVYWNETDPYAGIEFPLNLSQGQQITGLDFGSNVYFSQTNFQAPYNRQFKSSNYTYFDNYVSFGTRIQQARQNIYPYFAQNLSIDYKVAVEGLTANQLLVSGNLFFPGLATNHSLVFNLAYQQKGSNNVIGFTNNFPFARGYFAENLHQMDKFGADYHFPVLYPDAGVANTIYFLRIRGNAFFDYTRTYDNFSDGSNYKNFRSAGLAVFFDTQWFNQVPISFGFRYDRLLDPDLFGFSGRNRFEVVLPVAVF